MKMRILVIALICGVLTVPAARAQIQQGLEYSITPYLWAMGLDGAIETGTVGGDIDVSFSDILDKADLVVPLHFEAKGPVWTLIAEINFAALSQELAATRSAGGEAEIDMLVAELLSGYQFSNFAELIFGARYTSLDTTLKFRIPGAGARTRFDSKQDWVDPVIGIRYSGPISRRWIFSLRADVAGFGLGSDLTWNVRTGFGVEVSDVTTVLLGWHTMDIDYDDNNFVYDMAQQGPEFGVSFKF